jgi:hypothetical protein
MRNQIVSKAVKDEVAAMQEKSRKVVREAEKTIRMYDIIVLVLTVALLTSVVVWYSLAYGI